MGREESLCVGGCQSAQAAEFIRALHLQLLEMNRQLAQVEGQGVTGRTKRACAMRNEAAALRRDITEAQTLIDRLQRRYGQPASRPTPGSPSA